MRDEDRHIAGPATQNQSDPALAPAEETETDPTALALQLRGFFHGRTYFMVRSGRLQWIIQTDRADLGPAITGYLFDADSIDQNSKSQAYNFTEQDGVRTSALEVVPQKSHYAFTAFGEHTRARWVEENGIPAVEATWWADGLQVTERFSGMSENNTIRRTITLRGANLHGDENYCLRLRLPSEGATAQGRALLVTARECPQALLVTGNVPVSMDAAHGAMEIGPLTVSPSQAITVETYLLAQIPANSQSGKDFQQQIECVVNDTSRSQLLQATRQWWAKTSTVKSDDELVREVYDHARFIMPSIAFDSGTVRTGPFQYPAEWVRDSSQFSLGLTAAGHFELARAVLEHCIRDMLTAEGTTMIAGGFDHPDREQFDQTGELMFAVRWYTDFSGDPSLVTTYRNKLIALVERPLNPNFRDATGLVHNRREFWEQTMKDAYELAYNTYVCVGLREGAAMAPLLGAEDRRQKWLHEADVIEQAMMKILVEDDAFIKRRNVTGDIARHLVNPDGPPNVPSMNVEHHLIYPDATMALPIALGLVAPNSPLALNTLDEVEKLRNLRWSGGGYDRYDTTSEINMPGPWGIAGALILRGQHAGGRLDRSRETLEWFRNVEGGNGGLYYEEVPLLAGGQQQNWLGLVSWPTGELPAFFVRDYLGVTFDGDAVVIRPKLFPESPPVKADLRFRSGRLRIDIDGSGPVKSATVDGRDVKVESDGSVRLPDDIQSADVVIRTH